MVLNSQFPQAFVSKMLRLIQHNSTNEHWFVRSLVWVGQRHFIKLISSVSMTPFFPLCSLADWFPAHHPWRRTMPYIHDEKLPTVSIDVAERGNLLLRTMPNAHTCCNSKPISIIIEAQQYHPKAQKLSIGLFVWYLPETLKTVHRSGAIRMYQLFD